MAARVHLAGALPLGYRDPVPPPSPVARPFVRGDFDDLPAEPRRPHRYFETRAHETEVDTGALGRVRIHWREHGEGPPLLLVHGLMTTSYSWRYVLDDLGARFRLVIPDLPGCGRSDKPAGRYTAAAMAEAIGGIQRALDLRGCAAIGNSLGGYLCMRLALADPGAFSRLINVHSPGVPDARLRLLHRAMAVPGIAGALAWWVRGRPQRWAHANVHYWDEGLKSLEEAREYGDPLATPEGSRAFTRWLGDTLDPAAMRGFVAELEARRRDRRGFPVPLCLVYARRDPMVPPRVGVELAALVPDAEMHWLEDSSHFAHVDSPERLVPLCLEFLERGAEARRA